MGITDIVFDFEDIQEMFRLKEINVEMINLICNGIYLYMHTYLISCDI